MKNKNLVFSEQGFTLIELLITMLIMLVGLVAMAEMQITAMHGNVQARNTTERTTAAQAIMDELMALPFIPADASVSCSGCPGVCPALCCGAADPLGTGTPPPYPLAAAASANPHHRTDCPGLLSEEPAGMAIQWTVQDNPNLGFDEDGDGASDAINNTKLITVTVTWPNSNSSVQLVGVKPRFR